VSALRRTTARPPPPSGETMTDSHTPGLPVTSARNETGIAPRYYIATRICASINHDWEIPPKTGNRARYVEECRHRKKTPPAPDRWRADSTWEMPLRWFTRLRPGTR
jgi:hypothetical protein